MKFHNIGMVGPFVNQKLGSLPIFDTERDQGRLIWLLDGTLWYGAEIEWIELQKNLSDSEIASGLEKIIEGSNTGWRLKTRDPDFFGNIGQSAVDISTPIPELNNYGGATGSNSFAQGLGTISQNPNQFSGGRYNVGSNGDTIHETGIGVDNNNRLNAFEIYTNGLVTAPELTTSLIGSNQNSLITKEYFDGNAGGTGLERITEGSNNGWRLTGQDPNNYGNIGVDAVDMSISNISSSVNGATGNYSISEGYNTISSGIASHATGQFNIGVSTETIFETGIGTSDSNRMNAFEIYRDGTLTAPESTISLISTRGDKTLVTKEYTDATYLVESYADTRYLTQNNASVLYATITSVYDRTASDDRYVNVTGDTMTGNLTFASGYDIYADTITDINGFSIVGASWSGQPNNPPNNSNILSAGWDAVSLWGIHVGNEYINKTYTIAKDEVVSNIYNINGYESTFQGVRLVKDGIQDYVIFRPNYDYTGNNQGGCYLGTLDYRWRNIFTYAINSETTITRSLNINISGNAQLSIDNTDIFYNLTPNRTPSNLFEFEFDINNIIFGVDEEGNNIYSVNDLLPLMTKVIQNQKQMIDDLTSRIEVLE